MLNKTKIKNSIHVLVNKYREANGRRTLIYDDIIEKVSFNHSKNMGTHKVHVNHDGFKNRLEEIKHVHISSKASENIIVLKPKSEFSCSVSCVNKWIQSPKHKKSLLSRTKTTGIGVYCNDEGIFYITQIFV